ncbi:MAG: hypothetical protein HYV07_30305 [Deltaproteobacteria bacterium]|nr:hypothetical protein [Deltaproteobacteria bacterium]
MTSALGCGAETTTSVQLSVASDYAATGVLRLSGPPEAPRVLELFRFTMTHLAVSGAKSQAEVTGTREPIHATGAYDGSEDLVTFSAFTTSLTSTGTLEVQSLGFKLTDGRPSDGIADEISGFLEGVSVDGPFDGSFLGISSKVSRIEAPKVDLISASPSGAGELLVLGSAGAIHGPLGVELYRFTRGDRNPASTTGRASDDGSFRVVVSGVVGDILVIRANAAGVPSEAVSIGVTP